MTGFLCLLACSAPFQKLSAQVERHERIEIDLKDEFYVQGLYNFGEDGVVLSAVEDLKRSARDPRRMYIFYDSTLRELESMDVDVDFRRKLITSEEGDHNINTLYYDSRKGNYTVMRIDPEQVTTTAFEGVIPSGLTIEGMRCLENFTVLYAVKKHTNLLLIIDLRASTHKMIEFEKQKGRNKIWVIDFQTLPGEKELSLTVQEYQRKTMLSTGLYQVGEQGELSGPIELDAGKWNILDATSTRMLDGRYIVAGTYSAAGSSGASGLFISSFLNNRQEYFRTYNFTDFENFFSYLNQRSQQKMESKVERKKMRGKEVNLSLRMALHNMVESDGSYYILGEAYYPTYRTETITTYVNGRPNTATTTVFDGYQYTHAVLSEFNADGEKLRDYIFEMWPEQKPFHVKHFVELNVSGEVIKMAFVDGSVLKTRVLKADEWIEQADRDLLSGYANDKVRFSTGTVEHFYGNHFISYGSQKIRNREDRDVKRKHEVFYMQKLSIR